MDLNWKSADKVLFYISLDNCKDGWLYSIAARNATLGIYRAKESGFEIRRFKMGHVSRFIEYHWDMEDYDPRWDTRTVKPIEEIEKAPEFETEQAFIEYMEQMYVKLSRGIPEL